MGGLFGEEKRMVKFCLSRFGSVSTLSVPQPLPGGESLGKLREVPLGGRMAKPVVVGEWTVSLGPPDLTVRVGRDDLVLKTFRPGRRTSRDTKGPLDC